MKNSIGKNALINALKTVSVLLFPLITFPYISHVFSVSKIGIYNFCVSVVSYFLLLASLGIPTYSIREGARYRDNKEELDNFSSEVFSINIISTIISYIIILILISINDTLFEYKSIILMLSINIFFTTIGCEWLFNLLEKFRYIAIRTFIFQVISLVLMFIFVKTKDDLYKYVLITVFSTSGANILNFFSIRKYCHIRLVFNKRLLIHLLPIFTLFINSVMTTIYVNSDTTMLGFFSSQYYTGLYSTSSKIYSIVKQVLSAIIIVSIPRLSNYVGIGNKNGFNRLASNVFEALVILVLPAVIGLIMLSRNIIIVFAGENYLNSVLSLQILSISLLFCIFSWFYTSCVLVPNRAENKVLIATISAASINVLLNIFLIPIWMHNAAALTTAFAEFISMVICFAYSNKFYQTRINYRDIMSILFGCISIVCTCYIILNKIDSIYISTFLCIVLSAFVYFIVLWIFNNSMIKNILKNVKNIKKG